MMRHEHGVSQAQRLDLEVALSDLKVKQTVLKQHTQDALSRLGTKTAQITYAQLSYCAWN